MNLLCIVLALLAAFACGSIPTALLMGKLKGIDIRTQGSGNVGATNAFRILGPRWGIACLLVDILKGWLPVHVGATLAFAAPTDGGLWMLGVAAIAGHMFSPFLNFKGGKGVATTLGVVLAIAPLAMGFVFGVGVAIILASGYVSAASMIGAALLPLLILLFGTQFETRAFHAWTSFNMTLVLGALIIWKHRGNWARLRAGTEKRIVRGIVKPAAKGANASTTHRVERPHMLDKAPYTPGMREVLKLSKAEAGRLGHEYIGPEHYLFGVIRKGDGLAIQTLSNFHINVDDLKMDLERRIVIGKKLTVGLFSPNKDARRVLETSKQIAQAMKHGWVGTEHLLLALIKEEHTTANECLRSIGLEYEKTHAEVINVIEGCNASKGTIQDADTLLRADVSFPHHLKQRLRYRELNIILRAEAPESLEAVRQSLESVSGWRSRVNILYSGTGGISESDIRLAILAHHAMIIGFYSQPYPTAAEAAQRGGIEIRLYSNIHNLVVDVKKALVGLSDSGDASRIAQPDIRVSPGGVLNIGVPDPAAAGPASSSLISKSATANPRELFPSLQSPSFAVLGAGTWGITLAHVLAQNGHRVCAWDIDAMLIASVRDTRRHPKLPGFELHPDVTLTSDLNEALSASNTVLLVVPSQAMRPACEAIKKTLDEKEIRDGRHHLIQSWIIATKGIEQGTLMFMNEVVADVLGSESSARIAVLSGPSHAEEVSRGLPTTLVACAAAPEHAAAIQRWFFRPYLRIYTHDDLRGVELGAAVKNVIAIAVGISDGMGFGDNTRAALMTRGLAEIVRLGMAMGAKLETFLGLSGVGDLIVTATSRHSRNHTFGELLAQGLTCEAALKQVGMVVEGYHTVRAARDLARRHHIAMPITEAVYAMLHEGRPPRQAVEELLGRDPKPENY